MTVQLLPAMASPSDAPVSGGASVHSNSEESVHPSVVSDLFDGDLGADELNGTYASLVLLVISSKSALH